MSMNNYPPHFGGTVTEKQIRAVYAIARAACRLSEAEVEIRCQERYHRAVKALSKVEASQFIDDLKAGRA